MYVECRYCERPEGYMGIPINEDGIEYCVCGAEWADARLVVGGGSSEVNDE